MNLSQPYPQPLSCSQEEEICPKTNEPYVAINKATGEFMCNICVYKMDAIDASQNLDFTS